MTSRSNALHGWMCWVTAGLLLLPPVMRSESVKDREGAVRKDRAEMENHPRWRYNDFNQAREESRRTGKPLLVVFRCVPCIACSGIDSALLLESEALNPLLDQFVCLRVINANGLDLNLFQFDFDLSFSAVALNADGTVYGRFGSWTHQRQAQERNLSGLRHALDAALVLHRGYPANRSSLAGKQPRPMPWKTPIDIPTLSGKYVLDLNWSGKVVPSCVHCHQIDDARRLDLRNRNQKIPADLVYPWPSPETIGIRLALDQRARVEEVQRGSLGERSGLRVGDDILTIHGQPLISVADVSWVLHEARDAMQLPVEVERVGKRTSLTLELPPGWRSMSDISRRVGTWGLRAMALGGLQLETVSDEERRGLGLPDGKMALRVRHAGEYGKHAAAKNAGFKKGDVVVRWNGDDRLTTESQLIGHSLENHAIGTAVPVDILRGTNRLSLKMPIQ